MGWYYEATETAALSVRMPQRECFSIDYARRSTGERSLDTGSIPVYSTLTSARRIPGIRHFLSKLYIAHS